MPPPRRPSDAQSRLQKWVSRSRPSAQLLVSIPLTRREIPLTCMFPRPKRDTPPAPLPPQVPPPALWPSSQHPPPAPTAPRPGRHAAPHFPPFPALASPSLASGSRAPEASHSPPGRGPPSPLPPAEGPGQWQCSGSTLGGASPLFPRQGALGGSHRCPRHPGPEQPRLAGTSRPRRVLSSSLPRILSSRLEGPPSFLLFPDKGRSTSPRRVWGWWRVDAGDRDVPCRAGS